MSMYYDVLSLTCAAISCALLSACCPHNAQAPRPPSEIASPSQSASFESAKQSLLEHQHARSKSEFLQAASRNPRELELFIDYGSSACREGQTRFGIAVLYLALSEIAKTSSPEEASSLGRAYASLASCYEDIQALPNAAEALRRAVVSESRESKWLFDLGRLSLELGQRLEATQSIIAAINTVTANDEKPDWLWRAHKLAGDLLRETNPAGAVTHYRAFLTLASPDNVFRDGIEEFIQQTESPETQAKVDLPGEDDAKRETQTKVDLSGEDEAKRDASR